MRAQSYKVTYFGPFFAVIIGWKIEAFSICVEISLITLNQTLKNLTHHID